MGGVCQIAGELAVGAGMALAAGGDDVVPAKMRARIVDWQNVVRSMTVVTLGGLQVSQFGDLPVECLEVRLGDLLVTAAALVHDAQPELGEVRALDAVGGVAIVADRQRFAGVSDIGTVDAGGE